MSDTDSPTDTGQQTPSETPSDDAPPVRRDTARSAVPLVLAILALVVSIGLAVAAYFIWYQVRQLGAEQAGIESGVGDRIQPLRATLERLEKAGEQESGTLHGRIDKLEEDQQAVGNRLSVLAAQIGRSERGWTLSEVEYLLRIANQRLQLQRDTATAAQALRAADGRLRDLADPVYQSVREQIAKDLDAVEAVPPVDVDGLSAALSAALAQVDELQVAGSHYVPPARAGTGDSDTPARAHSVAELGEVVWHSLSELFRVREHDQPVGPLLPPDQEYFLRQNLQLQLAAARLALLRDDRVQYRTALESAIDWLNRYFDRQTGSVQQLLDRLQAVAGVNIEPAMPDISGSLRLLRQQMQLREQQKVLPVVPQSGNAADKDQSEASGGKGGADGDKP